MKIVSFTFKLNSDKLNDMINFWKFEKENRRKSLIILFILLVFFVLAWWIAFKITLFFMGIKLYLPFYIYIIAALITMFFYFKRADGSIREFLFAINALPIDKEDFRHRRVENIINEISVAAGIQPPTLYIFPSYIKNAFTVKTEKEHIVVISEGVAGNMRRDEIQAIVAHEIGHIVDKDTEIKTFIVSLSAGLVSAKSLLGFASPTKSKHGTGVRIRGRFGTYIIVMYLFLTITQIITKILSTMVSRQREYLADMKSTEFTRNPEALARALYIIDHDRINQLINLTHPSYSMLFLINPLKNSLGEKRSLFANLFSTHPPTFLRIRRMLELAHLNPGEFYADKMKKRLGINEEEKQYFVKQKDKWLGPFTMKEIREKFKDLNMIKVFSDLHGQESFMLKGEKSDYSCPRCGGGLYDTFYEDIPITLCQNCGGVLIKGVRLKRSLIREDPHPDIKKEKEAIKTRFLKLKKEKIKIGIEDFDSSPLLNCPVCGNPMARFFYSYNLPVVIDFCYKCDLYFLDKGELDLLQS
jgi:heat shock protein HtpX